MDQSLNLIDEEIRRLQELRKMAESPHMLDLMRRLVSQNGNAAHHPAPPNETRVVMAVKAPKPSRASARRGLGLTDGITEAVKQLSGVFTIHEVYKKLGENGVVIGAAKPMIAISGVLQRLVERGTLVNVSKGKAGMPSQYRNP